MSTLYPVPAETLSGRPRIGRRLRRIVALSITVGLAAFGSVVISPTTPATAAPIMFNGLDRSTGAAYLSSGVGTDTILYRGVVERGLLTYSKIQTFTGISFNGMAFREADGYLYAMAQGTGLGTGSTNWLVQLNPADGTVTKLRDFTAESSRTSYIGTFGMGKYADTYFTSLTTGVAHATMVAVDFSRGTSNLDVKMYPVSTGAMPSSLADIAPIADSQLSADNGYLIGIGDPQNIYRVPMSDPGAPATVTKVNTINGGTGYYSAARMGNGLNLFQPSSDGVVRIVRTTTDATSTSMALVGQVSPPGYSGAGDGSYSPPSDDNGKPLPINLQMALTSSKKAMPGDTINMTATVKNAGPGGSMGASLAVTVPPQISNISVAEVVKGGSGSRIGRTATVPYSGCTITTDNVDCAIDSMLPGEDTQLIISGTISDEVSIGGSLAVSAKVESFDDDANVENNAAAFVTKIAPDLSIADSAIAVTPPTVTADGNAAATVTVTLRGVGGNALIDGEGQDVVITSDLGTVSAVKDNADSTYTATVTSIKSGKATLSVTVNDTAAPASATVDFVAGKPANPGSTITATSGSKIANGTDQHILTVKLADALGNAVTGNASNIKATTADQIGSGEISGFTETTTGGTYNASVTSTVSGVKQIVINADGTILDNAASITFGAGTVDTAQPGTGYSVTGGDVSVDGGTHQITVTLVDKYGNPVDGKAGSLSAVGADLGMGKITEFTSAGAGTYVATITSSKALRGLVQTLYEDTPLVSNGNVLASFVAAGVDVTNASTRFSVTTGDEVVGEGVHTVTVTLADAYGNVVAGQADGVSVTSEDALGDGKRTAFVESATTPGTYQATVGSTVSGNKKLTVKFGGDALTATGTDKVAFIPGAVDLTNVGTGYSADSSPVIVGVPQKLSITLADRYGNAVPGQAAQLRNATADDLGTGTLTTYSEQKDKAGTYTASIVSSVPGPKNLTATYAGDTLEARGNTVVTFVAEAIVAPQEEQKAAAATGGLASTGSDVLLPIIIGAVLLLGGAAALIVTILRRRKTASATTSAE